MNNTQFATAIHILTLLANTGERLSSAYMAGSIGINPAMVRKSVAALTKHGFVEGTEGKGGGITLSRPASKILLSEVYDAVRQAPLLGRSNNTNPACSVGRQINTHLEALYAQAETALVNKLGMLTLAEFEDQFD